MNLDILLYIMEMLTHEEPKLLGALGKTCRDADATLQDNHTQ